jgi:taurine transport system substrate-binding protein
MRAPRRRGQVIVALIAATVMLAACGGGSGSSSDSARGLFPDTITIGYQRIPNGDLVVKHDRLLEKAFGPKVRIEWKLFDSGGAVNDAIVAGSIDIGQAGSNPVARGLSTKIGYQVPWIFDVIGKAEALVVKDNTGVNSIKDLKGRKVATPFASTAHYSLLAALRDVGLSETDVTLIDARQDAIAALWAAGGIDAAYVWNPTLAGLVSSGGKILITSEDMSKKGTTTYDLAVVTDAFAAAYPDAVKTWAFQQAKALTLIKEKPDQAARSIAAELGIGVDEAKRELAGLIFVTANDQTSAPYLGGGLAENLIVAARFNKALGLIGTVESEDAYRRAVVTTFASVAAKR